MLDLKFVCENIEEVKQRARKQIKTIVLPEAEDIRILEATEQVLKVSHSGRRK